MALSKSGETGVATLGPILKGEDKLYAIVCAHVTTYMSHDSSVQCQRPTNKINIGKSIQGPQLLGNGDHAFDIDIVGINDQLNTVCGPDYKDSKGKEREVALFKGSIKDLVGRHVFHATKRNNKRVVRQGVVTKLDDSDEFHFFVSGIEEPFAERSHSGSVVAIESDNNTVYLVGIITGGELNYNKSNENYVRCLCLNKGLKVLSERYSIQLEFCLNTNDGKRRSITPGDTIYFPLETIKPTDFQISDQLIKLINLLNVKSKPGEIGLVIEFEKDMNDKVFTRDELSAAVTKYDHPDQNCIYEALVACEFVYTGKLKKAEKHLKQACRMIASNTYFPFRLLCKVICYTTWLLIEMEKYEDAGKLLEAGIEYMEYNQQDQRDTFPQECLGYQYYDQSRYLRHKGDLTGASRRAHDAYNHLSRAFKTGSPCRLEYVLSAANKAHLQLACGEHFQTHQSSSVSDIDEASETLESVRTHVQDIPSVDGLYYLVAECDFEYRKGHVGSAIEKANKAMGYVNIMHLYKERAIVQRRLDCLHKLH